MLGPGQHCFILGYERNRKQQLEVPIQSGQQKLARGTPVASQGRNHHVRVEDIRTSHWQMILQAISLFKQNVCHEARERKTGEANLLALRFTQAIIRFTKGISRDESLYPGVGGWLTKHSPSVRWASPPATASAHTAESRRWRSRALPAACRSARVRRTRLPFLYL